MKTISALVPLLCGAAVAFTPSNAESAATALGIDCVPFNYQFAAPPRSWLLGLANLHDPLCG